MLYTYLYFLILVPYLQIDSAKVCICGRDWPFFRLGLVLFHLSL